MDQHFSKNLNDILLGEKSAWVFVYEEVNQKAHDAGDWMWCIHFGNEGMH